MECIIAKLEHRVGFVPIHVRTVSNCENLTHIFPEQNHPQAFVSSAFYPLEFPTLDNSTPRLQPVPSISASAGRAGVGQGGGQVARRIHGSTTKCYCSL